MTKKLSVLLVEDDPLIGMDLSAMLEDAGYVVDGPHSVPESAIDALMQRDHHVALLDYNLGRAGNSLPIARELVAKGRTFAFLTGYDSMEDGQEDFGHVERFSKPVDTRHLMAWMQDSLRLKQG